MAQAKPNNKINTFITAGVIRTKRSKRMRRFGWWVSGIIAGIAIIGGILYIMYRDPAQKIYANAVTGKEAFLAAQELLLNQDFVSAGASLQKAINEFTAAEENFEKFKLLTVVPWVRTQIHAIDDLLAAGVTTGRSLLSISRIAHEIISPLEKDDEISLATLTDEETAGLLQRIQEAGPDFVEAKNQIDVAVAHIDQIPDRGLLSKIGEAAQPLKQAVPQLQSAIDQAISGSQIIPWVAGYPDQRTYLFLLQNNTELRATGGFIGTYGILKVKNGDIKSFETDNVYNLDEPAKDYLDVEPPWPLTRYNAIRQWFFRDSNWDPHFPASAEKAIWFYEQERGPEKDFDGVIAVTPTFIQSLIALTGPISISGIEFNQDNFVETLQYQVDRGFLQAGLEESERKEIIGALSSVLLEDVISLPRSRWTELWEVFNRDIDEKHILMYTRDETVQAFIEKENWGGVITRTTGDYLGFFDANLASLKSDPVVDRNISYTVQRDSKNIIADVYITYSNTGTITWKTTRYRSYTRVYTPSGATLLTSEGPMVDCKLNEVGSVEITEEYDKTIFGAFICIEPGETKTLHYKYRLPDRIYDQFDEGTYTLLVQKQAGAQNYNLSVEVLLQDAVRGAMAIDMNQQITHNDASFTGSLAKDRLIEVSY